MLTSLGGCAWLAVVALLLAGCGAGTSSPGHSTPTDASVGSSSSSAVGSEGLVAQADRICRKGNVQLARSSVKGKQAAEAADVIVDNERIERRVAGELAKLSPPAELAPALGRVVAYRRTLANQLGDFAVLARRKATASFPALAKKKLQAHKRLQEVASRAGFKDCAKIG